MAELVDHHRDLLELMALEGAYVAAIDTRDCEAWALLFTEDGSYEPRGFGRLAPGAAYVGRDALKEVCRSVPFAAAHILGLPHFRIDGDVAYARIGLTSATAIPGEPATSSVSHGYYDVTYHRTSSGWAIHCRISFFVVRQEAVVGGAVSPLPWANHVPPEDLHAAGES